MKLYPYVKCPDCSSRPLKALSFAKGGCVQLLTLREWLAWFSSHELGQWMCWGGVISDQDFAYQAGFNAHYRRTMMAMNTVSKQSRMIYTYGRTISWFLLQLVKWCC
jgi:hypothetical protein